MTKGGNQEPAFGRSERYQREEEESDGDIKNEGARRKYIWGDEDEKEPEMMRSDAPKPLPYEGVYETIDKAIAYAKRKIPKLKQGRMNRWRDYSEEER